MITVREAEAIINEKLLPTNTVKVPLEESVGNVLASEVRCDRDFPPFDRVFMDGIAIVYSSFIQGNRRYPVQELQRAGIAPTQLHQSDHCIEVMTGAVLPAGTDTVIRYEDLRIENGYATIIVDTITQRQNIHPRGQDAKAGAVVLAPGTRISAAETALLAAVGIPDVDVLSFPAVAVVSTGDELVAVEGKPEPWQIRRSNVFAVAAALRSMGVTASTFHVDDNEKQLDEALRDIMKTHKVMILSGGVSKGKYDFVPKALEKAGIQKLFHEVSQRPGKPLWFGRSEQHIVFGLPGNPVSTYACFYRYIKPWIERCLGVGQTPQQAVLATAFQFKPALTYFLQVKIVNETGRLTAYPDPGGGSGDFANLRDVDGFLELPLGRDDFRAGESFNYFPFRR